jgi:hypothetical protein
VRARLERGIPAFQESPGKSFVHRTVLKVPIKISERGAWSCTHSCGAFAQIGANECEPSIAQSQHVWSKTGRRAGRSRFEKPLDLPFQILRQLLHSKWDHTVVSALEAELALFSAYLINMNLPNLRRSA